MDLDTKSSNKINREEIGYLLRIELLVCLFEIAN
jgi:hypothetical protein